MKQLPSHRLSAARLSPLLLHPKLPSPAFRHLSRSFTTSTSRPFFGNSLISLRRKASDSPTDLEAQRELFTALFDKGKEGEVVDRWEELTRLWEQGDAAGKSVVDVLRDDELFRLYLRSLAAVSGGEEEEAAKSLSKIAEAPPKRQELLASLGTVSASAVSDATVTSAAGGSTSEAGPEVPVATLGGSSLASSTTPSPPSAPSAASPLSPGGLITALFSGANMRAKGGDAKVLSLGSFKSWDSASSSGKAGSAGVEPIRVVIEEAKVPIWFRAGKFLLITALYSFLM